jgi:hypothetical protein
MYFNTTSFNAVTIFSVLKQQETHTRGLYHRRTNKQETGNACSMGMVEIRCTVGLKYHATAAPHESVRKKIGPVIIQSCPFLYHVKILLGDFNAELERGYFQTDNWD